MLGKKEDVASHINSISPIHAQCYTEYPQGYDCVHTNIMVESSTSVFKKILDCSDSPCVRSGHTVGLVHVNCRPKEAELNSPIFGLCGNIRSTHTHTSVTGLSQL